MSPRWRDLLERSLAMGSDPSDSADLRFRKRLLVATALIILPAGLLWGYLYWVAGDLAAALLPWGYVVEPLGFVDVKGKGAVETWRLVAPNGSPA